MCFFLMGCVNGGDDPYGLIEGLERRQDYRKSVVELEKKYKEEVLKKQRHRENN